VRGYDFSRFSVGNGIYRQTQNFPFDNKTYWWSVHVTDPSGSGKWTNHTYISKLKQNL
jgi:hypothetical protein